MVIFFEYVNIICLVSEAATRGALKSVLRSFTKFVKSGTGIFL